MIYGTGGATLSGPVTLANSVAVTGTGSFSGNITAASASITSNVFTVNGISLAPLSVSTGTVGTGATTPLFTATHLPLSDGHVIKAKAEIIAISADKADACSWELSIVGHKDGSTVSGSVVQIVKDPIVGSFAPNFDIVVETVTNGLKISVNDATQGGNVYWYGQITKRMILNNSGSIIA
jgi:hypothetical protein